MSSLTESLENRVGFEDLLLNPRRHIARHRAQILQNEFGGFGLAGSALAGNDARLKWNSNY